MQFQDGQTKVINGVTYTRTGGQWIAGGPTMGSPASTVTSSIPARGPVYGTPPTPDKPAAPPKPEIRDVDGKPMLIDPVTATATPISGLPGGENDPDAAVKQAIRSLDLDKLLLNVDNAERNMAGGWATGIKGTLGGMVPGSDRNDFLGNLESLEGALIMEKLAALKAASATGASGMGALSEREGARLAAAVASLRPDMSEDELRRSLETIRGHATTLKMIAEGNYGTQTPEGVAEAGRMAVDSAGQLAVATGAAPVNPAARGAGDLVETGGEFQWADQAPPQGERVTPEQEAALQEFLKTGPNAAQLQQWFRENTAFNDGIANAEQVAQANREGRLGKGFDYGRVDEEYADRVKQRASRLDRIDGEVGAGKLLLNGATLDTYDELSGGVNAIGALARGENPVEAYTLARDAERLRFDEGRERAGWGGTLAEIGGGLVLGGGGALRNVAPLTVRQAAGQGARVGALGGFTYGRGTEGSIGGALIGGSLGAVLGASGQALANRAMRTPGPPAPPTGGIRARDIVRAGQEENVGIIGPMVNSADRAKAGRMEAQTGSAPLVVEGFGRVASEIEDAAGRLVGRGRVLQDNAETGSVLQRGILRDHRELKDVRNRLYGRAERSVAAEGNPDIVPAQALQKLDDEIAKLQRAPNQNANEIVYLEGLRADLARPGLKLQDIRDIRTGLRKRIKPEWLGTVDDARAMSILDRARDDIAAAVSPRTANNFARADRFEVERRQYVQGVVEPFIGKKGRELSPERAAERFRTLLNDKRGDARKLQTLYRRLDRDEAADLSATFASTLGRADRDSPFEIGRFLSNTKDLSPSARRVLFGEAGAKSIDNLRTLSRALIDAQSGRNPTKSGVVGAMSLGNLIRGMLVQSAGVGAGVGSGSVTTGLVAGSAALAGVAAPAAARNLSARAMMSPRLTRWMVEAMQTPQARLPQHINRLAAIGQREPALLQDIGIIRQTLSTASADEGKPDDE